MIKLGDKVKDKISGLVGIVTSKQEFLNGCIQFSVMPPMKKGSEEMPSWFVDESQLTKVSSGVNIKKKPVGGPTRKV